MHWATGIDQGCRGHDLIFLSGRSHHWRVLKRRRQHRDLLLQMHGAALTVWSPVPTQSARRSDPVSEVKPGGVLIVKGDSSASTTSTRQTVPANRGDLPTTA
jgi:hypothetical protein